VLATGSAALKAEAPHETSAPAVSAREVSLPGSAESDSHADLPVAIPPAIATSSEHTGAAPESPSPAAPPQAVGLQLLLF